MEVEVQQVCRDPHGLWAAAVVACVSVMAGAWVLVKLFRD